MHTSRLPSLAAGALALLLSLSLALPAEARSRKKAPAENAPAPEAAPAETPAPAPEESPAAEAPAQPAEKTPAKPKRTTKPKKESTTKPKPKSSSKPKPRQPKPAEEPAPAPAVVAEPPAPQFPAPIADAIDAACSLQEKFGEKAAAPALAASIFQGILSAHIPGVEFLTPDEFAAQDAAPALATYDSGIVLAEDGSGHSVISFVAPGSPAAAAGIAGGDRLLAVFPDGAELPLSSAPAPRDALPLVEARDLLAHGSAPALTLQVRDTTNDIPQLIPLTRREAPAVAVSDLPASIAYIRLFAIDADLLPALRDAAAHSSIGVILDLRGLDAPQTALPAVYAIAAGLTPRTAAAPHFTLTDLLATNAPASALWPSADALKAAPIPLVAIVDETTAGAAEPLAALFAHSVKSAIVIGRPTAGRSPLRRPVRFPTADAPAFVALLPAIRLAFPDGATLDASAPVAPDVLVTDAALAEPLYEHDADSLSSHDRKKATTEEDAIDRALRDAVSHDPYLRRATDILLGLQAFSK